MASFWHLLLMVLSSLLLVAGYKLPTLRFLVQDGTSEENVETHNLRVQSESPLGAPGQWEWKTGGDVTHELPQRPRRKRMAPNHSSFPAATISTQALNNTTTPGFVETRTSADVPVTTDNLYEDDTTATTQLNTTQSTTPTHVPVTTSHIYEDDTTDGVVLQSSDDLATTMGMIHLQNSSVGGTQRTTVALKGTMEVSRVTKGKGLLVDEASPSTSFQPLVSTSDVSTETLRQNMVTTGPDFRAKGKVKEVSVATKAVSTTTTTVPAKPPLQKSPPGTTTILVGKCLLAIFLLALVAGIFIVITAVLATLLWRQKQAYKLSQHNHTEMVCISSLLAPDEAEEAGGRHPRVRRVRMLGENTSETEMDNLTLNSFLPDH